MPTLLSINNYFYRRDGSEVIYFEHNRLLEEAGWDIVPFSMRHPENPETPWSKYFVEELEFGADYSLWEKAVRVPKVIYSLEARRKLKLLLKDHRPDICHCHSIYHHLSPSILPLLRQRGIPTLMTLHDLKIVCPAYHMFDGAAVCERCKGGRLHNVVKHRCMKDSRLLSGIVMVEAVLHRWLKSYASNVDCFIVPCRFYRDKLVEWGWDAAQFAHIPNFVDPAAYRADFSPGSDFLYFGRLSPEKGLVTLIRAAARAGVALRFAGSGPQENALRQAARESGAEVTFLGHLAGEALHAAIRASRATLLPAEWYENASISILESFALGRPVIAAAIGGIPEQVTNGETGATFESGSLEQLAARLEEFRDMPDDAIAEMGRTARRKVEQEFSPQVYADRMKQLYTRVGAFRSGKAGSK